MRFSRPPALDDVGALIHEPVGFSAIDLSVREYHRTACIRRRTQSFRLSPSATRQPLPTWLAFEDSCPQAKCDTMSLTMLRARHISLFIAS